MYSPTPDYSLASKHSHGSTLEGVLRECVNLPVKKFALIIHLENGDEETYTSMCLAPYRPMIFSDRFRHDFRHYAGSDNCQGNSIEIDFRGPNSRKESISEESFSGRSRRHIQRESDDSDQNDPSYGMRKRHRNVRHYGLRNDDEDLMPLPVPRKTQQLAINNEKEVERFFYVRFKDMQQSACKIMGKAFIKLVEPKKQTQYPYTQGDAKAPPWWPKGTGDSYVRHKEPDHLLRAERIHLLVHILKLIIEPVHRQCPTVQRLGLNVTKLEEVTVETLNNWFHDPDYPENAAKKRFLKEIFKIAKLQEKYKNGELDNDTQVSVMYGFEDELNQSFTADHQPLYSQISNGVPKSDDLVSPITLRPADVAPHSVLMPTPHPLPIRGYTHPRKEDVSYPNAAFLSALDYQSQAVELQDSTCRASYETAVTIPATSPPNEFGWQNSALMRDNGTVPSDSYVSFPPHEEHSSFASSSYVHNVGPQDANRSFSSLPQTSPSSAYSWENPGMMSSHGVSRRGSHVSSPHHDGQFQLPAPVMMQHHTAKHSYQGSPTTWGHPTPGVSNYDEGHTAHPNLRNGFQGLLDASGTG